MSLLFVDGFDHYGTGGAAVTLGKWGTGSTSATAQPSPVRTGTHALRLASATVAITTKALPASGGAIVGGAIWLGGPISTPQNIFEIYEGGTLHIALGITTLGFLTIKRGTTVLATGTSALVASTWYYLEVKTVINDTTGSYEVRIDGVTEAALTASGVDTRNGGTTGQWDRMLLNAPATGTTFVDDFYLADTSGVAPTNTFLGAVKIEALLPQTDAVAPGSNAGLTPSTGTDHGALVDEIPPNTTDHNSSPTVGLKDTYHYPSMTLTGAILGIQTNLYVQKSDAAARQVCAVVRTNNTDFDGANAAPLTTFSYLTEVRALNPNTGVAWTIADITAIQAGMKITA